jgi:hypothetical protein
VNRCALVCLASLWFSPVNRPVPLEKPVFILIHSPLVGPLAWQPVADELTRWGYRTVVPRLDLATAPYWRGYADLIARATDSIPPETSLIPVAHSAAGLLLPTLHLLLPGRPVYRYLAVDAALPRAVTSLMDIIPPGARVTLDLLRAQAKDGLLPAWGTGWPEETWSQLVPDAKLRDRFRAQLRPIPLALYEEPIPAPGNWPDAPCAYLQFSELYRDARDRAAALGCRTRRLAGGHLHMLVDPVRVADELVLLSQ